MTTRDTQWAGVILPTQMWAQHLHDIEKALAAQMGLRNFLHVFTLEDATRLVHALVEDMISERLEWMPTTEKAGRVSFEIMEHRNGMGAPGADLHDLMFQLWETAVGTIVEQIQDSVAMWVPDKTWNTWNLQEFGKDMRLERGEDYRVMEWQRMKEEQEQALIDSDVGQDGDSQAVSDFMAKNDSHLLLESKSLVRDTAMTVYVPWVVKQEELEVLDGRTYMVNQMPRRLDKHTAEREQLIGKRIMLRCDLVSNRKPMLPLCISGFKRRPPLR